MILIHHSEFYKIEKNARKIEVKHIQYVKSNNHSLWKLKKKKQKKLLTVLDAGIIFDKNLPLPPTGATGGDALDDSL